MNPHLSYHDSDSPEDQKSMLFCWECDYADSVEGNWVLQTQDDYIQYVCPQCDTVLTERPCSTNTPVFRRRPAEHMVTAWQHLFQASIELWNMPFETEAVMTTTPTDSLSCG